MEVRVRQKKVAEKCNEVELFRWKYDCKKVRIRVLKKESRFSNEWTGGEEKLKWLVLVSLIVLYCFRIMIKNI